MIFSLVNLLHILFKKIVALYTLFLYLQELSILFCLSLICCSTECSGLVLLNIYSRNAVNEYVLDVFDRMPERKYQLLKTSNMLWFLIMFENYFTFPFKWMLHRQKQCELYWLKEMLLAGISIIEILSNEPLTALSALSQTWIFNWHGKK